MNYTQQQIEKLLIERDWVKNYPQCKELASLDAELEQVFTTDERGFVKAAKAVYQRAA